MRIWSREAVPAVPSRVSLLISIFRLNLMLTYYGVPPEFRGGVRFYYICMYGRTYSKSNDKPGKVANPARDQLNRENGYFPVPIRA